MKNMILTLVLGVVIDRKSTRRSSDLVLTQFTLTLWVR